ncbi:MAG: tetratricopeptide repeat protein [Pedosphaera sp.]|nr:tetratricopeptide repeat protein [Pedosphaera sp.]
MSELFSENPSLMHVFRAAHGWYELGLPEDAATELSTLPLAALELPEVLKLRFHVARARKSLEEALSVAESLIRAEGDELWGWLYRSQALHWLGQTVASYDLLLPKREAWPKAFEIPYDLACYCAQFNRIEEARNWYFAAIALSKNPMALKSMALNDPDLESLWSEIAGGRLG